MCVPHRHIHISRFFPVKIIIQYFVCSNLPELNSRFSLNHYKPLHLASVIMISPCNTGNGGRKTHLATHPDFYGLDETTSYIGMLNQFRREIAFHINIATKCIKQIHFMDIIQRRNNSLLEIQFFKIFKQTENFTHLHLEIAGYIVPLDKRGYGATSHLPYFITNMTA